jgi:hypothetical protein
MRQRTYDLTGWSLFGVGCLFFVIQGMQNGSPMTLIGSALFLIGVVIVLVPYFKSGY